VCGTAQSRHSRFAPAAFYRTGARAAAVTAADFTGHGLIDLVVAHMLDSTMVLRTNRGDCTFPRSDLSHESSPGRILTTDFNGDGRPDLAITTSAPTDNLVVILNQGGGRFVRSQALTVASVSTPNRSFDGPAVSVTCCPRTIANQLMDATALREVVGVVTGSLISS